MVPCGLGFVWVFGEFQFGYWVLFGFGYESAVVVVGDAIGLLNDGWRWWIVWVLGFDIGFCLGIGFGFEFESMALVMGGAIRYLSSGWWWCDWVAWWWQWQWQWVAKR